MYQPPYPIAGLIYGGGERIKKGGKGRDRRERKGEGREEEKRGAEEGRGRYMYRACYMGIIGDVIDYVIAHWSIDAVTSLKPPGPRLHSRRLYQSTSWHVGPKTPSLYIQAIEGPSSYTPSVLGKNFWN